MSTALVREQLHEAMRRGYVAAYRLLGNPDESRDACQEAATRALAAGERYDPARPFYPWFYQILKNHCLDRLKRRKRFVTTSAAERAGFEPHGEQRALAGERFEAVSRAIAELPDELREVVELRHFQDLSYEEMSAVIDCPLGTVMSRLYRARRKLRELLAGHPAFADGGEDSSSPGAKP